MYIIFGCLFALVVVLIINQTLVGNRFNIIHYTYKTAKLQGQKLRIVLLSDLHNKCYGTDNEELVKAIDEAKPDLVICAGDMITAVKGQRFEGYAANQFTDSGTDMSGAKLNDDIDAENDNKRPLDDEHKAYTAYKLLEYLAARYPVYYGLGNHESRLYRRRETFGTGYEDLISTLRDMGVKVLVNEHEALDIKGNTINIYGLDIAGVYYRRFSKVNMPEDYIPIKVGAASEQELNLLIAHNPDYFKNYKAWGADISFSGHLHGGVLRLPGIGGVISPQFHLFPKYSGDIYVEDGRAIVVSKGIGEHTMPLRINNTAELIVLDVIGE